MALSPAQPAQPGAPYWLSLAFYDESAGVLTDPSSVQLDITYGEEVTFVPDEAGPFTWDGSASAPADSTIWRTGTGSFTFWWDVPQSAAQGVYVASWTVGFEGDNFLVFENFPLAPGVAVPAAAVSGDTGYWTGSLSYQPSWSPSALTIPLGATDANGVTWTLQQVQGWDSAPVAVGQVMQRPGDHGGWPTAQFLAPRAITLTVQASAPSQAARDIARSQLQQAVPVSDLATFAYDEPVPKVAYVRRNATSGIGETYPTLADVVFSIPLVAPDPRKYAAVAQSASSLTSSIASPLALPFTLPVSFPAGVPPGTQGIIAVNSGTFETRPVVTVQGPVTSPSVTNAATGEAVTFTGLALAPQQSLVLDMDARQAFLDGAFTPADSSSAWWVLWPGTSVIVLTGTKSAGSVLSMTWSSAWAP